MSSVRLLLDRCTRLFRTPDNVIKSTNPTNQIDTVLYNDWLDGRLCPEWSIPCKTASK